MIAKRSVLRPRLLPMVLCWAGMQLRPPEGEGLTAACKAWIKQLEAANQRAGMRPVDGCSVAIIGIYKRVPSRRERMSMCQPSGARELSIWRLNLKSGLLMSAEGSPVCWARVRAALRAAFNAGLLRRAFCASGHRIL